jgi:hypothetical protein
VKWSEGLNNRVSINIRKYRDFVKFAVSMAVPFIKLFYVLWIHFVYKVCVLYVSV